MRDITKTMQHIRHELDCFIVDLSCKPANMELRAYWLDKDFSYQFGFTLEEIEAMTDNECLVDMFIFRARAAHDLSK